MLQKEFVSLNESTTKIQMAYNIKEEKYAILKKRSQKAQSDVEALKKKLKHYKSKKTQDLGQAQKQVDEVEKEKDELKGQVETYQIENQQLKAAMEDLMQKTEAQRHVTIEKNKL